MARVFDGANDSVHYPITAASNFTTGWSLFIWAKRSSATLAWNAGIAHHNSSALAQLGWEISGQANPRDHVLAAFTNTTTYGTARIQSTDGWAILGVTKTAGTTIPRAHLFKAGVWTHETMPTTSINAPGSQTGGTIRIGEYEGVDDFNGLVAADAGWNVVLSDVEVEELTADMADWIGHSIPPIYCHQHTQAASTDPIVDLMGAGHDSSAINGTSMNAGDNPSGWAPYSPGGSSSSGSGPGVAGQFDAELNARMWF